MCTPYRFLDLDMIAVGPITIFLPHATMPWLENVENLNSLKFVEVAAPLPDLFLSCPGDVRSMNVSAPAQKFS